MCAESVDIYICNVTRGSYLLLVVMFLFLFFFKARVYGRPEVVSLNTL